MLIDWTNLQPLPRRNMVDPFDRDRLGRRGKRNHPKRHGENRERAIRAQMNAAKSAEIIEANRLLYHNFIVAVRAYWSGERDTYPTKPLSP